MRSTRGSRASAFRAGSARYTRLRFARVPHVLFSAGSACVVAFNFFQEINILPRILPLLLLTIYNLINFTISIISTTSAILLLLLLQLLRLRRRLLLLQEVVTVRAGSARLRFARVPRVLFCAGSARVAAFKCLKEANILPWILLLLLLIVI